VLVIVKQVLLAVVFVFTCIGAFAQFPPADFTPPNPTASDSIRARFLGFGACESTVTTVVSGSSVRTTVNYFSCITIPSYVDQFAVFGPLPAGTYSYEIIFVLDASQFVRSTQALVVAPVQNVPTLSSLALALLSASLTVCALYVLRR